MIIVDDDTWSWWFKAMTEAMIMGDANNLVDY